MQVTRQRIVTGVGFLVSPALIVRGCQFYAGIKFFQFIWISMSAGLLMFAASCSLVQRTAVGPKREQVEEVAVKQEASRETFVANAFCSACHYGFDDEELAANHKKAGIGCERCHGESERHRSDEDNVTPPEIMYPRAQINPTCMMCHPRHEIRHVESHELLLAGAETVFDADAETATDKLYCTTCHAKEHRINVRTIRWNKATGELLDE